MVSFQEKLAAAKGARPFKDVSVVLDAHLAARREELEQIIAANAGDQRLTSASPSQKAQTELNELLASDEGLITLRFKRLPGKKWAELTSKYPARLDSPVDRHYGYNYDAVCEAAVQFRDAEGKPYGVRVEDGEEVPMLVEQSKDSTVNEWEDLYEELSGHEVETIRDAVWELNEYAPQQKVREALKASGAATRS